MADKIMQGIGTVCFSIAGGLQAMALTSGPKQFALQIIALVCTGVSAGCFAMSQKVTGK